MTTNKRNEDIQEYCAFHYDRHTTILLIKQQRDFVLDRAKLVTIFLDIKSYKTFISTL